MERLDLLVDDIPHKAKRLFGLLFHSAKCVRTHEDETGLVVTALFQFASPMEGLSGLTRGDFEDALELAWLRALFVGTDVVILKEMAARMKDDREVQQAAFKREIERLDTPEMVADLVSHLCSEGCRSELEHMKSIGLLEGVELPPKELAGVLVDKEDKD